MIRRRTLTLLIIVLLIGIPAGYLVISANQSRASGKDKQARDSATGLIQDWPSRVQRRLYEVDIPPYATHVAYYETNNWKTSRLYVQFSTSEPGLAWFLGNIKSNASELKKGDIAISPHDRQIAGWKFTGKGSWSGLTYTRKNPAPTLDIVVDRRVPTRPTVYVVSRTIP